MSGSLWKERNGWKAALGSSYRYRLRFFGLIGPGDGVGARLCLWKKESSFRSNSPPEREFPLGGCSLSSAQKHTGNPYSFGIFHPERPQLFLLCPDEAQFLSWTHALESVLINPERLSIRHFEILALVGRGAFGHVFQVRKKDTGVIYALKVLDKVSVKKRQQVENTKSERRVLEIVNHPFIVSLHYAFETGRSLCLVMSFVHGGELFLHLRKMGTIVESDARIWAAEILLALEYLHSMDIIYRDLKPENILLDREGRVKLTDFGLARDVNDLDKDVAGSPYYMAPEVILLNNNIGLQADWWSLGVLIFEMLTGLPPFYNPDSQLAYRNLLTRPVEFPPGRVSRAAQELLAGLLERDPVRRLGARVPGADRDPFGDALAIRRTEWFRDLAWDRVLLGLVRPSFSPEVRDETDLSHFDGALTSDVTWKGSELFRQDSLVDETRREFQGFNYVAAAADAAPSRPTNFAGGPGGGGGGASGARSSMEWAAMRAGVGPAGPGGGREAGGEAGGDGGGWPPWTLRSDGGEEEPARKQSAASNASAPSLDTSLSAEPAGGGGGGGGGGFLRHTLSEESGRLSGEAGEAGEGEYNGVLQPVAMAGWMCKVKKNNRGKYCKLSRRWFSLVPSLGCCLYYTSPNDLEPRGVMALPPASAIYPKRGVIQVGGKVHVHSMRVCGRVKEFTLVCEDEGERDAWLHHLRLVGERWRRAIDPGQQLMRKIKGWSDSALMNSVKALFRAKHREMWMGVLANGREVRLLSEIGQEGRVGFRYEGQSDAAGARAGRGICWYTPPPDQGAAPHYFDGLWVAGKEGEFAMLRDKEGGLYEGVWHRGVGKQGFGRMLYPNGDWYEGMWFRDRPTGRGTRWCEASREIHDGEFLDGESEGHGTRYYPDGTSYTGGWHGNQKKGVGVLNLTRSDNPAPAPAPAGGLGGGSMGGEAPLGLPRLGSVREGLGTTVDTLLHQAKFPSATLRNSASVRCIDGHVLQVPDDASVPQSLTGAGSTAGRPNSSEWSGQVPGGGGGGEFDDDDDDEDGPAMGAHDSAARTLLPPPPHAGPGAGFVDGFDFARPAAR